MIIFVLLVAASIHRCSAAELTKSPVHWLNVAYDEGAIYGYPKTIQAIILAESSACEQTLGDDGYSYGCGQLALNTAALVEGRPIHARDLQWDHYRNIHDASLYFALCLASLHSWRRAIAGYNHGIPKAALMTDAQINADPYLKAIIARLTFLLHIKQELN